MLRKIIREAIDDQMRSRNWSQAQLDSYSKVSQGGISKYLSGGEMTMTNVEKLMMTLGLSDIRFVWRNETESELSAMPSADPVDDDNDDGETITTDVGLSVAADELWSYSIVSYVVS